MKQWREGIDEVSKSDGKGMRHGYGCRRRRRKEGVTWGWQEEKGTARRK